MSRVHKRPLSPTAPEEEQSVTKKPCVESQSPTPAAVSSSSAPSCVDCHSRDQYIQQLVDHNKKIQTQNATLQQELVQAKAALAQAQAHSASSTTTAAASSFSSAASASVSDDPKTRIQNCVNQEQKFSWEHAGKKELAQAVSSALDNSMIPDLQKIVVNEFNLAPSFCNTFIWQLKSIERCEPEEWKNKIVSKNLLDQTEVTQSSTGGDEDEDSKENENEPCHGSDENEKEADHSSSKKSTPISDKSFPPYVSKILGLPYLKSGELWPVCGGCHESLEFMFQLLLIDMPEHLGVAYQLPGIPLDKQLLQFFLCHGEDTSCYTPLPINGSSCARIVDLSDYDPSTYRFPTNKSHTPLDAELISGWMKRKDYPQFHPVSRYGVTSQLLEYLSDAAFPCLKGDKLSGFPSFVSDAKYPTCSICSQTMRFVFQVRGDLFYSLLEQDARGQQPVKTVTRRACSCCLS